MIEVDSSLLSEQPLSRYLSLAKFLDLVRRRRIYFAALPYLADRHEGSSTLPNMLFDTGVLEKFDALVNHDFAASLGVHVSSEDRARLKAESAAIHAKRRVIDTVFGQFDITESNRYRTVMLGQRAWLDVSCWHRNEDESLAMWKVYGGDTESVCVISSVGALASSLVSEKGVKIFILPVHYIDHRNEHFKSDHLLAAAIHKQKPYSYENEIRAIAVRAAADIFSEREEAGSYIDIEPTTLIKAVRLSPKAPIWFRELIQSETSSFRIPIHQSELDHGSIFDE